MPDFDLADSEAALCLAFDEEATDRADEWLKSRRAEKAVACAASVSANVSAADGNTMGGSSSVLESASRKYSLLLSPDIVDGMDVGGGLPNSFAWQMDSASSHPQQLFDGRLLDKPSERVVVAPDAEGAAEKWHRHRERDEHRARRLSSSVLPSVPGSRIRKQCCQAWRGIITRHGTCYHCLPK